MITIDGAVGEGGGQILRTSLALSLVTGEPFRIEHIRANRPKPGLLHQHLAAVRAAAEVGDAKVDGALLHSTELVFAPSRVRPGEYQFDVGTAGSTTLVFQTVLPALMLAEGSSRVRLKGGTHNSSAPPFDFLAKTYLPLVQQMGPGLDATLERAGFYPAGGGSFEAFIVPATSLKPLELLERGKIVRRRARALVARLPLHIAEREVETVRRRFSWPKDWTETEEIDSDGPGNLVMVELESSRLTEVFTAFGRIRVPAEQVAAEVVRQVKHCLDSDVPVGEHLADQLLIPLALAGGGAFRTTGLSRHASTNVTTIGKFLKVEIRSQTSAAGLQEVRIVGN